MDRNNLPEPSNFIEAFVNEDISAGKQDEIVTRFPPEPNGYLHIGHAKAICINFGIKSKYGGRCNLRFDDTNPVKEDNEYVESIQEDIKWLGFEWDGLYYASDYFEEMYDRAVLLIKKGLAYVCDLNADEIKNGRGSLTVPGTPSPYRDRSVDENLDLFAKMRSGEFKDGEKVLRAKIDMASPNMNMRDPVMYRILRAAHPHVGNKWIIYPMYDFAHPIEDAVEGVTHSLCSLEFEDHRPLYDWFTDNCGYDPRPRQIEFARLNITRTIMSKRFLKRLVDEKVVDGWNDPRLHTISGMRERGYPAAAIRDFCARIGVAKAVSTVSVHMLEHCVRDDLNANARRRMAVARPLKVLIENFPAGVSEAAEIPNHPDKPELGSHTVTFSREIYIEEEDFALNPPPKFFRLKPGGMVRLKGSYIIKCTGVETDGGGKPALVRAELIEGSKSGGENAGIKVKSTIHWVNAADCADIKLYMYDYLLDDGDGDFIDRINKNSLSILENAKADKGLLQSKPYDKYQFMRTGYFCARSDFSTDNPAFNLVVGLKDGFKNGGDPL
ncbi:MAG: glutamine--tRNA ligase/YqeY domain fusion protein [Clostridiales bacterium]|jgi:glutaminyl-tRNA synthetase|nr:glutamine--tRNA ligase/YqeY domain fusion protein [Clostridiales bacterium]